MKSDNKEPNWVAKAYVSNYDFFSLNAVSEAYVKELVSILRFSFNYKYEQGYVYYDQNNLDEHENLLKNNPELVKEQMTIIKKQILNLIKTSKKYGKKEDLESFEAWYLAYREFLPVLGLVLGLEQYLEKRVKNILNEEDFHKICFSKETETAKEQFSLLELSLLAYNSEEFRTALKKHLKEYSWIGNKMMNYSPTTKDVLIKRAIEARKDSQTRLSELKSTREKIENEAKEVLSKLEKEQKELIELYQEILYLRTARAEAISQASSLIHPLFSILAQQLSLSRSELLRFSKSEIVEMIKNNKKVNPDERKSYSATFVNGNFEVKWGEQPSVSLANSEQRELKGVIANRGLAKGTARLIFSKSDLSKLQSGDILVAPYTNPDLLQAIEKCSAILTDIGGLTSHAAIISRELSKPCIIDLKIATKIIKDGDLVEVNADTGTIRILNKV